MYRLMVVHTTSHQDSELPCHAAGSSSSTVFSFISLFQSQVDAWLLANPQRALGALLFTPPVLPGAAPSRRLSFVVQTNSSVRYFKGVFQDLNTYVQLPLQAAVERAAARVMTDGASPAFIGKCNYWVLSTCKCNVWLQQRLVATPGLPCVGASRCTGTQHAWQS